uniref:Cytochrome b n=1 Tax=Pseudomonas fluorescens TaxID=294 RepID=A0A2S1PJX4_PSEFL|nr:Putative cytochrome b [Pseudomonas fluorescens]
MIWIGAWCIGILATHWRDELNLHHQLMFLHKAMASTILFLVVARIAWRLTHPAPALPDSISPLMKRGAFLGHLLLYIVALVGLAVSGWYWSSVADKPIMVAGLFMLPPLVAADQSLYDLAKWIHTYTGWFCGALVGGHALVALKHHFMEKDNVLAGMLPERSRR